MPVSYNVDEVLAIAEQIERNGRRFYLEAAKQSKNERAKATLGRLAEMEAEHERTFAQMRADAAAEGFPTDQYDPDLEVGLYLQAIADSHVFDVEGDIAEVIAGKKSLEDILTFALGLEKESIVFYVGIKQMMPGQPAKDKIQAIIKEEMSHVADITADLRAIQG